MAPSLLDPDDVPTLPATLVALLDRQPTQPRLEPVTDADLIPTGRREATLCSILGAARRRGANEAELLALTHATNRRCVPPLADRDLVRLKRFS